jgi:peptide/nickel transport system permease protein
MASSIPASVPADTALAPPAPRARRLPWLPLVALVFMLALVVMAVAAPWIAPHDPERQSLRVRLATPTLEGADGRAHPLGTDHLGRDVLSRVIYGARVSLVIGFAAVAVGSLVGSSLGILAGSTASS